MPTAVRSYYRHSAANGGNVAPFLAIGQGKVIRSLTGTLFNPFDFMVAELQNKYPKDWDRAVNRREQGFRNELYALFPSERFVRAKGSIRLRGDSGTATDVDALVFDTTTQTLGLFQLKWQDPFGPSMRKRESKKSNLLREGNQWISVVASWLDGRSPQEVAERLGLRRFAKSGFSRVRLFVLGRHFSHFSGESLPSPDAAWGMWPQVLHFVHESYDGTDPVDWLYATLINRSPLLRPTQKLEGYTMEIGRYRIVLEPLLG